MSLAVRTDSGGALVGGMGAAPMPGSRDGGAFDWVILPTAGRIGPTPKLPARDWHAETRAWWKRMWSRPEATQWREDDPGVIRMAVLHQVTMHEQPVPSAALLTELRQLEDRFGLSPKARMQLRWLIGDAEASVGKPAPKVDEVKERRDRRRRLSG